MSLGEPRINLYFVSRVYAAFAEHLVDLNDIILNICN
jgi:hypothetical protein